MKKYESSGVLLYFSLLCDIYGNSYYIQINQDYLFDWADQMEKEDAEIKAMLDYMVELIYLTPNCGNKIYLHPNPSKNDTSRQKAAI